MFEFMNNSNRPLFLISFLKEQGKTLSTAELAIKKKNKIELNLCMIKKLSKKNLKVISWSYSDPSSNRVSNCFMSRSLWTWY